MAILETYNTPTCSLSVLKLRIFPSLGWRDCVRCRFGTFKGEFLDTGERARGMDVQALAI